MTLEEEFNLFYYGDGDGGYPRKEQRGDARKAFGPARKIASLEEIIEGRKSYAARVKREDRSKNFIKLPAGWLRAEMWADDNEPEEEAARDPWDRAKREEEIKNRIYEKFQVVK